MYKGTTPTFTFVLPEEADISSASHVYVSFSCNSGKTPLITKTGNDLNIDGDSVEVFLNQRETLILPKGKVRVQLNWTYQDGGITKRACSQIMTIDTENNLIEKELPNG